MNSLDVGDKQISLFLVGARDVYERAVEFFGEENADEKLFLAFAKYEENCKEVSVKDISFIIFFFTKSNFVFCF